MLSVWRMAAGSFLPAAFDLEQAEQYPQGVKLSTLRAIAERAVIARLGNGQ